MFLNRLHTVGTTAVLAVLLAAPVVVRGQAASDSPEISRVLTQAKANATLVANDADKLEAYARSGVSWQTHARQLERMKGHVNDLIGDVSELTGLRSVGSAWQQDAIDRVDPMLKSMADHLTATIQHLNENQHRIRLQPYQEYVHGNRVLADKTLAAIRDFVDYSEARAEADTLEQKLALTAPSTESGV